MDWFLYDNGLRHERVKCLRESGTRVLTLLYKNITMKDDKYLCYKANRDVVENQLSKIW